MIRARWILTAIALACFGRPANATIKVFCEPWKGGDEIRCEARKTEGTGAESFSIAYGSRAPKLLGFWISEWSSTCGLAGLIRFSEHREYYPGRVSSRSAILQNTNECYEVFFHGCYLSGNHEACTNVLNTTPLFR